MNDSGIQHKQTRVAPSGFGFDDGGERVPVTQPDILEKETETETREDGLQAVLNFIALVITDAGPYKTGQRVHLLAHHFGLSDCKTDKELARKLNLSPGRVSQIKADLRDRLRDIVSLTSRTAKARPLGR